MVRNAGHPSELRRWSRIGNWISYLIVGYVALRKLVEGSGTATLPVTIGLLVVYSVLLGLSYLLTERSRRYFLVYFLLQVVIIEALGLVQPYEDTWALLYIPLGFQIARVYPLRQAWVWGGFFAVLLTGTLILTTGWISGLGFSFYYIAISIFFVAYDRQYVQSEAAREQSQDLLAELEAAHLKLQEYSAQAEEVATIQEHNRLVRELHDSVSQTLFSITLSTQATNLLLEKDPGQVPERLDRLQELTSGALSQMRNLIGQWRPG